MEKIKACGIICAVLYVRLCFSDGIGELSDKCLEDVGVYSRNRQLAHLSKTLKGFASCALAAIRGRRVLLALLLVLTAIALSHATINLSGTLRLTPVSISVTPDSSLPAQTQALESQTIGEVFDRDTTTSYTAYGVDTIQVTFEGTEQIQRLKFYGPSSYTLSVASQGVSGLAPVPGWTNLNLSTLAAGWNNFDLNAPISASSLVLTLTPISGGSTPLTEVEFWGAGLAQNETDGAAWDTLLNSPNTPSTLLLSGREYAGIPAGSSAPGTVTVSSSATATFTVNLPLAGTNYRKAWLLYQVNGLSSWIAVPRTINGQEAAGGWPLPGSTDWSTQVEAIHPDWLNAGANQITFSMPNGVTNPYQIGNVKIVLEEDNGANLIDNIQASNGNPAVLLDGDETTGWRPYVDGEGGNPPTPSLIFNLARPSQVDSLNFYVVNQVSGQVIESVLRNGIWVSLGDVTNGAGLSPGWQQLSVNAGGPVSGVKVEFRGGDGSAGEIMEAQVWGSGVGAAYGPTIEVTYPDAGEFYGTEAYVRGFLGQASDAGGAAQVLLGTTPIQVMNGQFEGVVDMSQVGATAGASSWSVTVTALYPDGAVLTNVINLNNQQSASGATSGQSTYSTPLNPGQSTVLTALGSQLQMDASALTTKVNLQVVPLLTTDLEPLNPGMTNVTGGSYRGYRYLPHGTHFSSAVKLSIPYNAAMIPSGKTVADIRTFYYDTDRGMWVQLPLSNVNSSGQMLTSLTTHFTDFINATVTVPDHPQEVSFNPTELKDIKAADPAAELNLIEAPTANDEGDAKLSYPIEIPPGRKGLAPSLSVSYDSGGSNSWMGLGWNLSVPKITVETRWGATRYDSNDESEDYLLNGEQLVETGVTSDNSYLAHRMYNNNFVTRANGAVTFRTRVEGDFQRIIRNGSSPSSYWWEVDGKDGSKSFYGGCPEAGGLENGTGDKPVLTTDVSGNAGNICEWDLREHKDLNGNTVKYHYSVAQDTSGLGHDIYLDHINYTGTNGSDGPYQVTFTHGQSTIQVNGVSSVQYRPDVSNNLKCGFPRVSQQLLDHIDITLNGTLIRRYLFSYLEGAYFKTLLSSITQVGAGGVTFAGNVHTFTYYDDIRDPSSGGVTYNGFKQVNYSNDQDTGALGDTVNSGLGWHLYAGFAPFIGWGKGCSLGFKVGGSGSSSTGDAAFVDVTGRGVPDLVYSVNGQMVYQPNLAGPNGSYAFGGQKNVSGLGLTSQSNSNMFCTGGELYIGGINGLVNNSNSTAIENSFMADVNGDGVADLVNNGQVYFGHYNPSTGSLSYSNNTSGTQNPLSPAGALDTSVGADLSSVFQQAVTTDPLADTLRQWTAPYDGVVQITAPVTLVSQPVTLDSDGNPQPYPDADGVRAVIEYDGGTYPDSSPGQVLAAASIPATAFGVQYPLSVSSLTVKAGDRVYFRLQSIYDGKDDQVGWNPQVQYLSFNSGEVTGPVTDVNGKDETSYQASADFTLSGRQNVGVNIPLTGTVELTGDLNKLGATSDSVTVLVIKNEYNNGVSMAPVTYFNSGMSSAVTGTIPFGVTGSDYLDIPVTNITQQPVTNACVTVATGVTIVDQLQLVVQADSNIDLSQIQWSPILNYKTIAPPINSCQSTVTSVTAIQCPYDIEFYPETDWGDPQGALTVTAPELAVPAPPSLTVQQQRAGWTVVLRFSGTLNASGTTNPITANVILDDNTASPAYTQAVGSGPGVFNILGNIQNLTSGHNVRIQLVTSTQADLSNLSFTNTYPSLYYVLEEPNGSGGYIDHPDSTVYSPPYEAVLTTDGVTRLRYLNAQPYLSFQASTASPQPGNENLIFTIKAPETLIDKESPYVVANNGTVSTGAVPVTVEVTEGDSLFFDFTSRSNDLMGRLNNEAVSCYYGPPGYQTAFSVDSALHDEPNPLDIFSVPYRGWAYAGLKANPLTGLTTPANSESPSGPLTETDLEVPTNLSASQQDATEAALGNMKGIVFYPEPSSNTWQGPTTEIYVSSSGMESSRFGQDAIQVASVVSTSSLTPGLGGGALAQSRVSVTPHQGATGLGAIVNGSSSNGSSYSAQDYLDLNGDGYPDLVGQNNVQFTLPTGGLESSSRGGVMNGSIRTSTSASQNLGFGGNSAMFQTKGSGDVETGKNQMSPLGFFSYSLGYGSNTQNTDLVDMNGDGLPDKVTLNGNGTLSIQFNTGYGFGPTVTWGVPSGTAYINQSTSSDSNTGAGFNDGIYGFGGGGSYETNTNLSNSMLLDVNGDGLTDLVINEGNGIWKVWLNTGNGFQNPIYWTGAGTGTGSALTKSVGTSAGGGGYFTINIPIWAVFVPIGDIVINPGADFNAGNTQQQVMVRDIDGDGYPDEIVSTGSNMTAYINQTGRTNLLESVTRPMGGTITLNYTRDGNTFQNPHSRWVLSQVTAYDGGQNQNEAKGGADYQGWTFGYASGQYDIYDREFIGYGSVTEVQMNTDGWGGPSSGPLTALSPYRETLSTYDNASVYEKGLVTGKVVADVTSGVGSPVTYSQVSNSYQFYDINANTAYPEGTTSQAVTAQTIFPQLTGTTTTRYEAGNPLSVAVSEAYTYDSYGNVLTYYNSGDNSSDAVSVLMSYTASDPSFGTAYLSNYIVGLDEGVTVEGTNGVPLRERTATYDTSTGNLTSVKQYLQDGTDAETDLAYDGYGNINQVTGPLNLNNQRYQLSYQYDSVVQTYPVLFTDSFGYTSTQSYDLRYGKPAVQVDENGNHWQNIYDNFGRMVTIIGPFDTNSYSIAFDYHPDAYLTGGVPYAHTAHNDSTRGAGDTIDTWLFCDGDKKVIQTKKTQTVFQGVAQSPLAEVQVSGRVVYDLGGRAIDEYYPVLEGLGTGNSAMNYTFDTVNPTETAYDVLDRAMTVTRPDNHTTTVNYSVSAATAGYNEYHETVTDVNGNKKETFKDAKELIREVIEYPVAGSTSSPIVTTYNYDPVKQIISVTDAKNNTTKAVYDYLGRRTEIDSPDAGKTILTYDTASNVTRKVTSNLLTANKAISYNYQYNRLASVTYPTFSRNNVTYTYGGPGAANNGAARVIQVKDGSGTLSKAYDAMGNVVTDTRIINVPQAGTWLGEAAWDNGTLPTTPVTYVTNFTWDDWNRVQAMTYPDGEQLQYQYDSGGLPRAVSGLVSSTVYPYVQRLEYDKFGSRKFVQNGNGTTESYTYDTDASNAAALHRLTLLNGASGTVTFQNLTYTYDPVGNITNLWNNIPTVANSIAGPVSQYFGYDGLYRLTSANGSYSGAFNTTTGQTSNQTYSLAMSYDPIHNITQKNQVVASVTSGSSPVTDGGLSYDWNYTYGNTQPHAPSVVGSRTFSFDSNGNQAAYVDTLGTNRAIIWDEDNRMEAVQDGSDVGVGEGTRFIYDNNGIRVMKIDNTEKMAAYVNQFYVVQNPNNGSNSSATKEIFIGNNRICAQITSGSTNSNGSSSSSGTNNVVAQAEWIGSWGVSIASGDSSAASFGAPGNFVTVTQPNVQVLGAPQVWTKSNAVLGTVNLNQVVTLDNPEPQGGYFEIDYQGQVGYIPTGDAVVGIPVTVGTNKGSALPTNAFVFYYHDDHLGSTGYMTDVNGNLSEHLEYIPFGETWSQQQIGTQVMPLYQFSSMEMDTETGLYYFGARYYDPRLTLWESPDPILDEYLNGARNDGFYNPENLSLYMYCGYNPLILTDPDGLSWYGSLGRGVVKGGVTTLVVGGAYALVGGTAIVLTGGAATPFVVMGGDALAVGGSLTGGLALGTAIGGETLSGQQLNSDQRFDIAGQVVGGVAVGTAVGAAVKAPGVEEPTGTSFPKGTNKTSLEGIDPKTLTPRKPSSGLDPQRLNSLRNSDAKFKPLETDRNGNVLDGHHRRELAIQEKRPVDVNISR